jgi:hypothetical protein
VLGLAYLGKSALPEMPVHWPQMGKTAMRYTELHWPQLGSLSFLVTMNALLYLMGNGIALKDHRWKWLALAVMLTGPVVAASVIPYPANEALSVLELFPPPITLFLGLVWTLSGAITLILFIRHNPLPDTEVP